jgi:hypothetical protein
MKSSGTPARRKKASARWICERLTALRPGVIAEGVTQLPSSHPEVASISQFERFCQYKCVETNPPRLVIKWNLMFFGGLLLETVGGIYE